jgi:sec-independent protein translocase protein TatA
MPAGLQGWHLIVVLVVILLLFGATKLPALARSVGQSTRILKDELKSDKPTEQTTATSQSAPTASPAPSAPSPTETGAAANRHPSDPA